MIKIKLTAWERTQLLQFIGSPDQRGDLKALKRAIKVFDVLELTEDEKKEIGWTNEAAFLTCPRCQERIETSNDNGRWEDTEREFELSFEDADFVLLKNAVTFESWPRSHARLIVPMLIKIQEAK